MLSNKAASRIQHEQQCNPSGYFDISFTFDKQRAADSDRAFDSAVDAFFKRNNFVNGDHDAHQRGYFLRMAARSSATIS